MNDVLRINELTKEACRILSRAKEDKQIQQIMLEYVRSGMTPIEATRHLRELVIKSLIASGNY